MDAPSHTLLSALKRTTAMHRQRKAAASPPTTPARPHEHQPTDSESPTRSGSGVLLFVLLIAQPLLRIEQLSDRAVGGGLLLCLVNAGLMFGLFLLCSLYLQLALGHGPLATGLAFIPLAVAAGMGASVAAKVINRHGLRWATGPALALAAGGLLLLSHVPAHGSYLRDLLPGMLMAGFGLGLSGTAMAVRV